MLKRFFFPLIESFLRNISGGLGRKLRYYYYRTRLGACGKNVFIDIGVIFNNPELIFIGSNVWIDNYAILVAGRLENTGNIHKKLNEAYLFGEGELHLSGGNHIAPFTLLQAHGGISIGKNVTIAAGSKVYSFSHHYRNIDNPSDKTEYHFSSMAENKNQYFISSPVIIGDGAAVGLNSVVLAGTHIPSGTWIGVNSSVVGQAFKPNSVYASPSAVFIKEK